MVKKLLATTNEVSDEIQARIPKNLQDLVFHYLAYIKKLSYEKHIIL